jgi:assimilatory nitrate reductase catalytic subunit
MADLVCYCLRVEKSEIVSAIEGGCATVAGLTAKLRVGSGCGGCVPDLEALVRFYGDAGASSQTPKFVPYP